MSHPGFLLGLLAAVAVFATAAHFLRVPHAVVLVVGGLGVGFIPGLPNPNIDPEAVLLLFLPPILYAAAFNFAAENVRENVAPVGVLAVGLVVATVTGVAVAARFGIGLPWGAAFVLGAVLAPTDPVSATAVIRRLGAPQRVAVLLEGEALVNDGTGLVAYRVAIGAVGAGAVSAPEILGKFALASVGGAAIGAGLGWLAATVRRRVDEATLEIALGVLVTYGAFLAAEQLDVSGLLASVAAGLVVGRRALGAASPETRMQGSSFWEVTTFLAESALFLLIGLQFKHVLKGLPDTSIAGLALDVLLVIAVLVAVRAAWIFLSGHAVALAAKATDIEPWLSARERVMLSAGGMRGAVSVAAALAIPVTSAGQPFPDRSLTIFLCYTVVLISLVVPALGLPALIRALRLGQGEAQRHQEQDARTRLAHAALRRAEELADRDDVAEVPLQRAREVYEMRIAAARDGDGDRDARGLAEAYQDVRRRLLEAERDALNRLRAKRQTSTAVLRQLERELDLQEARLRD